MSTALNDIGLKNIALEVKHRTWLRSYNQTASGRTELAA